MATVLQSCLSRSWGGLEMVALETAERLRARGVAVVTACLVDSPLARALDERGLETVTLKGRPKYFHPGAVMAFRRVFRARAIDAVLVQHLRDLWLLVPAVPADTRVVGISHMFIDARKRGVIHRWLYRRLDRLVALTPLHVENLLAHLAVRREQMVVIPNAVDRRRFSPDKRRPNHRGEPLIGIVSRLDPNKGLSHSVEAAAELRRRGVDFRLKIFGAETAGESGTRARLAGEITALELDGVVELAGHADAIDVEMASFDVLLMPAPAETFGRVLIEAMASGVPVAAAAGGGVPNIVRDGENGLLFPPLDVSAMADALERLLASPDLRARFRDEGLRDVARTYDAGVVERALYRELNIAPI